MEVENVLWDLYLNGGMFKYYQYDIERFFFNEGEDFEEILQLWTRSFDFLEAPCVFKFPPYTDCYSWGGSQLYACFLNDPIHILILLLIN